MTIGQTTERGLCCGCGTCRVVCPQGAIEISYDEASGRFLPSVDACRCSDCGVCLKCCPSASLPDAVPTGKRAPVKTEPLAVYAAYARDRDLRWNSTSGGVVTAMVERLLSEGVYKRAFVVRYDRFDGTQAELVPVESPADVRRAARSKYVPVSVGRVVEAIKDGGLAGSVVVCTPCQLRAIRAALRHYGATDEGVLFIGLFCQSMLDYRVYAHYEREYGGYDTLHFRDKEPNGWPGDTSLVSNGEIRKVDRKVRMELKKTNTPKCCTVCADKLNEEADISVGDCYIPGFSTPDGLGGVSSVVIRTESGRKAFETCKDGFVVERTAYDVVRFSQGTVPREESDRRVYNVAFDIVSIANRGQWLMFEAMLEQVRGRLPNALLYVDLKAFRRHSDFFKAKGVLPLLDPSVIDLLLYAPGFRFSDSFVWSEELVRADISYLESFDKVGRKIVFMPQAFGPFAGVQAKMHIQGVSRFADLMFAREKTSKEHLVGEIGDSSRIGLSPDFTCLYHGGRSMPPGLERNAYVTVIPNVQMLTKLGVEGAEDYRGFMDDLLAFLLSRGETVVLLNHSGDNDRDFIRELDDRTGNRCRIVADPSAGQCKCVIAASKLLVTSRYHGLISGLTEGVPVLCTSWSHKYQEALDEFDCAHCFLDICQRNGLISTVEDALLHPDAYRSTEACRQACRSSAYGMWNRVFSLVPAWAVGSRSVDRSVLNLLLNSESGQSQAGSLEVRKKLIESQRRRKELWNLLEEKKAAYQEVRTKLAESQKRRKELWDLLEDRKSALAASQRGRDALWNERCALKARLDAIERELTVVTGKAGER